MQNVVPAEIMFIGLLTIGLGTGGIAGLKRLYRAVHADVLNSASRHEDPKHFADLRDFVRTSAPMMDFFAKYVFSGLGWFFVVVGVAAVFAYLLGFAGVNVLELLPK